ncbi:MAG: chloride channel protein [Acidimicrobiia bacterium]|nr:chloride channel protein [Acidimicrobiia bacterium]
MASFWARIRGALRKRGAAAFLIASLTVGVLVGIAAAALFLLVGWFADIAGAVGDAWGSWASLVIVPLGLFLAWLIARRFAPEIESGGVTETMVGLSLHGGYLPTRTIGPKVAATAITLGTGGSGGREGPAVMIGGAIGSSLARYTRFGEDQVRSLIAAGAGAGVGASFNAPIAGMLFALEVLLQNFAVRHLNAVVIASVAAAVTTQSIVGEERILTAPPHRLEDPAELLLYALLGLAAVAFGVMFLKILDQVAQLRNRAAFPDWVRPLVMGGVVGLIGLLESDALGTGQDFVAGLLRLATERDDAWWALVLVAIAKMFTNALTRSGGGSGGTFMPSLFVGASIGAALAIIVEDVWSFSDIDPGAFAVVGMAATFAVVGRAPLTAILIVFEITGDYGLVLPLMLATSLATFLGDRLQPASAYTMPLKRRGIHLLKREDIDLLDTITVGEVMKWPGAVVGPSMSTAEADRVLSAERHHGMPVVDDAGLQGVITVSDIARAGGPSDDVTVGAVMTSRPITVTPTMPVSAALARMAALGFGRLPVVSESSPTELVGMFRRESVVRAYHHALGASTGRHLYRDRIRQRTQPGASFYEVPVPHASPIGGQRVRDIKWPEAATLVSIRRQARVIIPHGNTVLEAEDVITAFGTADSRVELAYVLEGQSLDPVDDEAT